MNSVDRHLEQRLRRFTIPVETRGVWADIETRAGSRKRGAAPGRTGSPRVAWAVAAGLAVVALALAGVVAVYEVADTPQDQAGIVFTDLVPAHGATPSGSELGSPSTLDKAAPFTGTATLEQVRNDGKSDAEVGEDGVHWIRGRAESYRLSMSQPVVDGVMEVTYDIGTLPSGSTIIKGSWVLRTDQGTWKGSSWTGIRTVANGDQFYAGSAVGTGELEGLLLVLQWSVVRATESSPTLQGLSQPIAVGGWIQSAE